ncbi:MAG: sensor histidine kinase [Bacteroidales bacterium]|nr:sensor histidine kinase [Bacteroidales bacterium]
MTLKKRENIVYLIVWTILFLLPLTRWLQEDITLPPKDIWSIIIRSWQSLLPLLILFLIHNLLILPLLNRKGQTGKYHLFTILLILVFSAGAIAFHQKYKPPKMERRPPPESSVPGKPVKPPVKPLPPEATVILAGLLVIGTNLAISLNFKAIRAEQEIKDLEREKLEAQLKYLKYQINPHFFMNTLNNIHALVDIDPEEAKGSIVKLSGLMRYLLYEGDKPTIPLKKEIDLLNQYISLMKLRFDDSVKVSFTYPEVIPKMEVPVLLFISFVENAFKHGVSYQHESFIDITLDYQGDRLLFNCRNSCPEEKSIDEGGGIGITNSRRRLALMYGDDYKMDIINRDNVYTVSVDIPSAIKQV